MRKFSTLILVWFLLGALLIEACKNESTLGGAPYSVLDGSTCELPCWNNIIPKQTPEKEFLNVIAKLKYVDQNSIGEINISSKNYDKVISFLIRSNKNQENNIEVRVYIKNDTIILMNFLGQLGLSLGDIVLATGEPDILLQMTLPGNYTVVTMLNESRGLTFEHSSYQVNINLDEGVPITGLFLYSSDSFYELMDEGVFSMGLYNREETLSIMYPWDGYGNLDEKYPPRQP